MYNIYSQNIARVIISIRGTTFINMTVRFNHWRMIYIPYMDNTLLSYTTGVCTSIQNEYLFHGDFKQGTVCCSPEMHKNLNLKMIAVD